MQTSTRFSSSDELRRLSGLIHVQDLESCQELYICGPRAPVTDLAFARIFSRFVLAAVDQTAGILLVEVRSDQLFHVLVF